MTLREQLRSVAVHRVNQAWADYVSFPVAVEFLAAKAFKQNWDRRSLDARVVLRCAELLDRIGAVTESEPGLVDLGVIP